MNLWNGPGGLQSLCACGVVLCVALRKLFEWNLWTGETRERRRELLLYNPYLKNIRVLAGVTGRRMVCDAAGMSMLRGDIDSRVGVRISHVTMLKVTTTKRTGKGREGHVSSSLPSVAIRHTALQSHSFFCKSEPGGTVAPVRQPPSMVHFCVCGDADGLIWGVERCADERARGRSSNGRGSRSACDPDDCQCEPGRD